MDKRIFVEKKADFRVKSDSLVKELQHNLQLKTLKDLRIVQVYDVFNLAEDLFARAEKHIFSEQVTDTVLDESTVKTDLEKYVEATKLPFVAKGVLSVQDAVKARDAGCKAIVVSHHHGRIPFGIAPAQILPRIKEALDGSGVAIFADCSIDTGYDAYKLLALGADAVSVGRGILGPLLKEGTEGVTKKVVEMNQQLSELMMYTDVRDVHLFDETVLYI